MWRLREFWWDLTDTIDQLWSDTRSHFHKCWLASWRFLKQLATNRKYVPVLAMIAALVSAVASVFSWQTTRNANEVTKASQEFTQKTYRDQIAMGAPSISVISGETVITGLRSRSDSDSTKISEYAVEVVLRNSGLRDAKRAWVMVVPEEDAAFAGIQPQLVSLPKDVDIPVRFPLSNEPNTTETGTMWDVAVIYEDETPFDSSVSPASASTATSPALATHCSPLHLFRLTSWPKDPNQAATLRVLSTGTPFSLTPETPGAFNISQTADQVAANALYSEIANAKACQGN